MAGHATKEIDSATLWGGKGSPFSASYGKLMMWFFLVSDALTFGGLLVAYGYTRYSTQGTWPIGEETFEALPFLGNGYPLAYVALMTFILIVSSVTMVLAVEAGHRMDKKGVIKWMLATIIGGFFFLGSQAWEWSHFIHGTPFGKVTLNDGSVAVVKGDFGTIENFEVIEAGHHHAVGDLVTEDLLHEFQHAAQAGHLHGTADNLTIHLHDGSVAKVNKAADENLQLIIKEAGTKHAISSAADESTRVSAEEGAADEYYAALTKGAVVYGANMTQNEYGPDQYGQFFFFITGFHGFHVFSGVIINIIIFLGVLRGIYHQRGHYEMVEKTGLYWHFVDLVWVFVFTFFYLI
ncbi:cytochrome c oxidase subunit 3 [Lishizhenia sp.]|uniref:cytochrome c oxidase subunit 3 n=1 Tax=Lishizhenia sp. TaxID=2497594 RepID=UPI00299DAC01|nr:cytochrome c oxidase subunit 3 [Lishizhenia sp.]MDX1444743.1 cytochrome c oxidase subunit 3 [Lishizhenia sp.]